MLSKIKNFIAKETVLCVAAVCALLTMFIIPPSIAYVHYIDFRVLCLLMCLMAVVAGMKAVGVFDCLTYLLLRRIKSGRVLSVALVLLPFFCSMFVTNDVALIIFIPFTLMLLDQLGCKHRAIAITVFQTIAANLGSMATPVGNPQNLYLYSFYNLQIGEFFSVTLPLTIFSLILLTLSSFPLLPNELTKQHLQEVKVSNNTHLLFYIGLFILSLLTVFRVVPYIITTIITVGVLLIINKKILKEIDYMLLLTFVCFFIVSENLGQINWVRNTLQQLLHTSTLLTAVGTSQIISNVPAAVVLSGFTDQWKELLAGVNIGGLGTPIASLASLITMKFYMRWPGAKVLNFVACFMLCNVLGLIALILFSHTL